MLFDKCHDIHHGPVFVSHVDLLAHAVAFLAQPALLAQLFPGLLLLLHDLLHLAKHVPHVMVHVHSPLLPILFVVLLVR